MAIEVITATLGGNVLFYVEDDEIHVGIHNMTRHEFDRIQLEERKCNEGEDAFWVKTISPDITVFTSEPPSLINCTGCGEPTDVNPCPTCKGGTNVQ